MVKCITLETYEATSITSRDSDSQKFLNKKICTYDKPNPNYYQLTGRIVDPVKSKSMPYAREESTSSPQSIDGPWASASSYTKAVHTTNIRRRHIPLMQGQWSQQEWRTKQMTKARHRLETCTSSMHNHGCWWGFTSRSIPSTNQRQVKCPRLTRLGFTVSRQHIYIKEVLLCAANTPAHAGAVISQAV